LGLKIRTGTALQFQEGRANEQSHRYHNIYKAMSIDPYGHHPPWLVARSCNLPLRAGPVPAQGIASMGPLDLVPRLLKLSYRFLSLIWKLLTVKNLDASIENHMI
jgi:hypothetical protein